MPFAVLCRPQELLAAHIQPRDRDALRYLEDVRYVTGHSGMSVMFVFRENPYFEDLILRKGVFVLHDMEGAVLGVREEATSPCWKDGQSLVVRHIIALFSIETMVLTFVFIAPLFYCLFACSIRLSSTL